MKLSICQYSFNKMIKEQNWDLPRFVEECVRMGLDACDFHQRLVGRTDAATARVVLNTLREWNMQISAFSLGNNFYSDDPDEHKRHLADAVEGMEFGARIGARIIRFFGCEDRQTWVDCMETCLPVAEKNDLVIALENHGRRSSSVKAQMEDIEACNSPRIKALIDIGNYMGVGENSLESVKQVVKHCVYVLTSSFRKVPLKDDMWNVATIIFSALLSAKGM